MIPPSVQPRNGFFPWQPAHLIATAIIAALYLLWTTWVVGMRSDHLQFLFFLLLMVTCHTWTRTLTYSFIFFILFWVIYDSMRILPNYEVNDVHILQPYLFEKHWLGITHDGVRLTLNEYFRIHAHPIFDLFAGVFYLTWVPVPLALGIYFFFTDKARLLQFSAAYLFTNLIGFTIYYMYPAAPPWYVDLYGDVQRMDIPGHAAQLLRFDEQIGFPLFEQMYSKNANVFAAIPSLHAAYPVVTWFYARKAGLTRFSWFVLVDIIGIWFAAVYSFHHYLIDVLLGGFCALTAILVFEKVVMKGLFKEWLNRYKRLLES